MADHRIFIFYVIPEFRLRLVLIQKQGGTGCWVEHDHTELTQFAPLNAVALQRMLERMQD
jgi:hypothetical protein